MLVDCIWVKGAAVAALAIALAGCDAIQNSKVYAAADGMIKERLRSPSSYKVVSQQIVWQGKAGVRDAYVVKTEYDAQNAFGGTLRGCHYTILSMEGDRYFYNKVAGVQDCFSDSVARLGYTEARWIEAMIPKEWKVPQGTTATAPKAEPAAPAQAKRDFAKEANENLIFVNPASVAAAGFDLSREKEKHPAVLVNGGSLSNTFRTLMGKDFEEFLDSVAVASDVDQDVDGIFGKGIEGRGGDRTGAFAIAASGRITAIIASRDPADRRVRIYGAKSLDELPPKLKHFVAQER